MSNILTCRQIQRFLEHVKTGQSKHNHSGQRNIPGVSDTCVFFTCVFSIILAVLLRETSKITMEKKTPIILDSYFWSCCSLSGMVLHLDLLNYGEAVDRLSNCLLLSVFPCIHFIQHCAAAVSVCSITWLQLARVDGCTLQLKSH